MCSRISLRVLQNMASVGYGRSPQQGQRSDQHQAGTGQKSMTTKLPITNAEADAIHRIRAWAKSNDKTHVEPVELDTLKSIQFKHLHKLEKHERQFLEARIDEIEQERARRRNFRDNLKLALIGGAIGFVLGLFSGLLLG